MKIKITKIADPFVPLRRGPGVNLTPNGLAGGLAALRLLGAFRGPLIGRLLCVLACSTTLAVLGQYSIDWYTISGGGGSSSNGPYTLSGIIGQHAAGGPMNGGPYSVTGGFFVLYALQTPGAPLLTIWLTPTSTAVISWPSPSTGFDLQQNADLSTTNWGAPSEPINDNGVARFILVNPPAGNRFYRLVHP